MGSRRCGKKGASPSPPTHRSKLLEKVFNVDRVKGGMILGVNDCRCKVFLCPALRHGTLRSGYECVVMPFFCKRPEFIDGYDTASTCVVIVLKNVQKIQNPAELRRLPRGTPG